VSDLDGTLLRPDGTLGAATAAVVNEYIAAGGLFTYATARSFLSASRVTAALHLRLPVVTYGGAVVVDPSTGRARPAQMLSGVAVREVRELTADSDNVQPIVFTMRDGRDRVCWLADRATPAVAEFLARRAGDPRLLPLRRWSQIDESAVFYISLIGAYEQLRELRGRLAEVHRRCHVVFSEDIYTPDKWWLEIMSRTGTKAAALTTLKAEAGAATLVCFGDGDNDLPMFAMADTALAVANATPSVRAAATEVIGSNAADGVAHWIAAHSQLD
jgi:Cof subfamily protein (haloacid dehalogenase superfamily)